MHDRVCQNVSLFGVPCGARAVFQMSRWGSANVVDVCGMHIEAYVRKSTVGMKSPLRNQCYTLTPHNSLFERPLHVKGKTMPEYWEPKTGDNVVLGDE